MIEMTRVMLIVEADMLDMVRVGTERLNILEEMIVMDRVLDMQWVVGGRPKKLVVMAKMVCQGLLEISVQTMLMVSRVTWTPLPKASEQRVGAGMLDM